VVAESRRQTRIGLNLLTCNLAEQPLHLVASRYAVQSLLESDIWEYDWRLQIVDNGSTCPQTARWLDELQNTELRIAVEKVGQNLGIAKGRNIGYQLLSHHEPEFVVEVHTDHFFPPAQDGHGRDISWLGPIVEHMRHPASAQVGIVGPALLSDVVNWRVGSAGVSYHWPYEQFRDAVAKRCLAFRHSRKVVPGLTHPAVKRWAMLEQIGLRRDGILYCYDPDMPGRQNFEDTEEAFRAWKAGWQVLIHFGSVVYHHYHFQRLELTSHPADYDANNLYCQTKHGPEFITFATTTLDGWLDRAYRR